jgi:P2-related tail formation protein
MFSQRSASAQIETQKHHKDNTNIKRALIKSQTLIHRFGGALSQSKRMDIESVRCQICLSHWFIKRGNICH